MSWKHSVLRRAVKNNRNLLQF